MRVRCLQSCSEKIEDQQIVILKGSTGEFAPGPVGDTSLIIPVLWDEVVVSSGDQGFERRTQDKLLVPIHINYVEIIPNDQTNPTSRKRN